jgi:hypothetical protein
MEDCENKKTVAQPKIYEAGALVPGSVKIKRRDLWLANRAGSAELSEPHFAV